MNGLSPLAMQIIGLLLGSGILLTLLRIALLAGRYMQRLETAEGTLVILGNEIKALAKMQGDVYKEVLLIQGHLRGQAMSASATATSRQLDH